LAPTGVKTVCSLRLRRRNSRFDLFSTQAERDDAKLERVRNIPLAELHPFKGHPFKVQNNEEMQR